MCAREHEGVGEQEVVEGTQSSVSVLGKRGKQRVEVKQRGRLL